jgi:large subunit ribosomal protein L1
MSKRSKRLVDMDKTIDKTKTYSVAEALSELKKATPVKFDQSVEVSLKLGVDPKKADQQVRGTVSLPNGTGKKMVLVVLAKGDKVKEAQDAGADYVGNDDLIEKIKGGWTDFSAVLATPEMMREVGKLGKILGPRGLMPTPKAGTVTNDVAKAVNEIKAGKVEFRVDKNGVVNNMVGKLSFDLNKLEENVSTLVTAISRMRPASAKGHYMQNLVLSSTMGPGLKIDLQSISHS